MAQAKKSMRHRSGIKAHRQSVKRNLRNRAIKKGIRAASRAVSEAAAAKETGKLGELMAKASSALDKAAKTGAIHWKAAARKKSRLAAQAASAAVAAK
jgi:small subunit ribosomal protein S20